MYLFGFRHDVPRKYGTHELIELFEREGNVGISADLARSIREMRIRERGICIDFERYFREDNPKPAHAPFTYFARAMEKTLESASLPPEAVDGLVTSTSSPDYVAPTTSSLIIPELSLRREIPHYHLGGMGCAGSLLQLRLMSSLTRAHPDQVWLAGVGDILLPFIPSIDFFRNRTLLSFGEISASDLTAAEKETQRRITNYFIQIFLFADAAVGYLAAGDEWWETHAPGLPYAKMNRFVTRTNVRPGDSGAIYFRNGMGADPNVGHRRINYYMGREVMRLIPRYGRDLIRSFSEREWRQVFIHLGSHKILRKVQETGQWTDEQLKTSYETLASYGNVSQATVPLMWESHAGNGCGEESATLSISFGIGFTAAAAEMVFHANKERAERRARRPTAEAVCA